MRRHTKVAAGLVAVGLLVTPLVARAGSTSQPANKAAASGRRTVVFAPNSLVELLRTVVRTSKPEDLILQISMECSILTSLVTDNNNKSATTLGRVRVWVEMQDGPLARPVIVPIADTSTSPQTPSTGGTKADDSVVFCDRTYHRTVTPLEPRGDDRLIDKQLDYIRTKSANAFNWLRLNAGSGLHTITVKADLTTTRPECSGATTAPATSPVALPTTTCSQAYVGNRTLIVEPTRTAVNALIS